MKFIRVSLLILGCALAFHIRGDLVKGRAKDKPNLSGTWVLDRSRSDFSGDNSPLSNAEMKLSINHKEPSVRVIWNLKLDGRALAQLATYYTDGRGEENPSLLDANDVLSSASIPTRGGGAGRPVKSKTKWEGNKLVTNTSDRTKLSGRAVDVEIEDVWELAAGGKTLTQTTTLTPKTDGANHMDAEAAQRKFKRVYNRVEQN